MEKLVEIGRELNKPCYVVKFQRLCGVYPRKRSGENGCVLKAPAEAAENHKNVVGNGVNGDVRGNGDFHHNHKSLDSRELNGKLNDLKSRPHQNGRLSRKDQPKKAGDNNVKRPNSRGASEERDGAHDYEVRNKYLYWLFSFGANLGNEPFYITFFPWWLWNIDGYVGRRVCLFWCLFMYVGQATKDIIKWPRPPSPPVLRLEKFYALEYGMPSTHAMTGAGLPFSLFILTKNRYIYPWEYGLAFSITWCVIVCLSRLYLGMHSILDILAGLAYVFLLMPIALPAIDYIDDFMLTSPWAPLICVLVPVLMCTFYPSLEKWSTARSDTTLVQGVGAGIAVAHWVCFQYGMMVPAPTPPPYNIIWPTWGWVGMMLIRFVIGGAVLGVARAILKPLIYSIVCRVQCLDTNDQAVKQKLSVELPYKLFTYLLIAMCAILVAPLIFRYFGVERETYFTEI